MGVEESRPLLERASRHSAAKVSPRSGLVALKRSESWPESDIERLIIIELLQDTFYHVHIV